MSYTLDTNSIIYYLHGDRGVASILDSLFKEKSSLYVPTVSEVELFGFPFLNEAERRSIEKFLESVSIVPLDSQIARIAATMRSRYKIKIPDSIIAATTLFTRSTLITRNIRDFKRVPELKIINI